MLTYFIMNERIEQFLEKKFLRKPLKKIICLNRGGTSANYCLFDGKSYWLLKILDKNADNVRGHRFVNIYQKLQKIKGLSVPKLIKTAEFEGCFLILMDFIQGKKLKPSDLSESVLAQIETNYRALSKADFIKDTFVNPSLIPSFFEKNNESLIGEHSSQNFWVKFFLKRVEKYNHLIFQQIPQIKKKKVVIHGDTGPNNFILDDAGKIYFLDFEMIREGYLSEDLSQLVLSAVLQHAVWFFDKKLFLRCVVYFKKAFDLSYQDWVYGMCIYFLRLINRRLHSDKLLKSPRKSWLLLKHLQKFEKVIGLLKTVY